MSRKRFAGGIAVNWQHFYGIGIVPRLLELSQHTAKTESWTSRSLSREGEQAGPSLDAPIERIFSVL